MSKLIDNCDYLKDKNYVTLVSGTIVISYLVYRITRTLTALCWSIFLYRIIPLVHRPNLAKYKLRWTVVTGATDGIGRAYTLELTRHGIYKFFLIGRNEEKLYKVKNEIESINSKAEVKTFIFDFQHGDFALLRKALENINVGLGVNSVGVGRELLERYGDNPTADNQLLKVNALGAAEFMSCILSPMERYGGGQIVTLSSSQGIRPIVMLAAYSATKAIDREYSTISVQCLTPALVATKMTYYKNGSLFVVSAEQFAREAVSVLGFVHRTSGCLNHEIQLLLTHLFPWSILKYLMMPIYWRQQSRMARLKSQTESKSNDNQSTFPSLKSNSQQTEKRIIFTKISATANSVRYRA